MAKQKTKKFDPLKLDGSPRSSILAKPNVRKICEHINKACEELWKSRHPNGEFTDDKYRKFNEGMLVKNEVLIALTVEEIRKHPELLHTKTEQQAARKKLHEEAEHQFKSDLSYLQVYFSGRWVAYLGKMILGKSGADRELLIEICSRRGMNIEDLWFKRVPPNCR